MLKTRVSLRHFYPPKNLSNCSTQMYFERFFTNGEPMSASTYLHLNEKRSCVRKFLNVKYISRDNENVLELTHLLKYYTVMLL